MSWWQFGNAGGAGIEDLDIAVSETGMEEYIHQIKIAILNDVCKDLETERDNIMKVINEGWVGKSRDAFEKQFNSTVERVEQDLQAEYLDLKARLQDLANFYFNQDKNMMGE